MIRPLVYAVCRQVLRNDQDTEDAVQETFIKLASRVDSIRSNPRSWIHSCAMRTALDLRGSERARKQRESSWASDHARLQATPDPPALALDEMRPAIDDCLAQLPADERTIITGYYYHRRTLQHLADEHGVSHVTVKFRLDKAMAMLRRAFNRRGVTAAAAIAFLATWAAPGAAAEAASGAIAAPSVPAAATSWSMKTVAAVAAVAVGVGLIAALVVSASTSPIPSSARRSAVAASLSPSPSPPRPRPRPPARRRS